MKKQKSYFSDTEEEWTYSLDYHIEQAKEAGLKEIKLYEPVRDKNSDAFGCAKYWFVGLKGEDNCGKICEGYEPRNGKSGICKHHRYTYEKGEAIIIKIK